MTVQTQKLKLHVAWSKRAKLRTDGAKLWTEGAKLWTEGAKLWTEGAKPWAEGAKLRAEGDKLRAEGDKLRADGDKLWAEAIIEAYGNIQIKWSWKSDHGECWLENGDIYDSRQLECET